MRVTTISVRLLQKWHVFQTRLVLELEDAIQSGTLDGQVVFGYPVPDTGNGTPGIIPADGVEKTDPTDKTADAYYGKCIGTQVSNFYRDPFKNKAEGETGTGVVLQRQVEFVHYPDCQQMGFHMPKYAWDAGMIRLINRVTGEIVEEMPVRQKLSGGAKILLDTLPFQPGFYSLEADWPDGWTHQINFIKFVEGFPQAETYQHPPGNVIMVQNSQGHRLYDSAGVEIDNGANAMEQIIRKVNRRLEYQDNGREGIIRYLDGRISIDFSCEYGAGKRVELVFIPTEAQWESNTSTPLALRKPILKFMAQRIVNERIPGGAYQIELNIIRFLGR